MQLPKNILVFFVIICTFLFNNSIFSFVVPVPRRLRFKVLSAGKLLVSWKEPKGEYDGYKFIYNTEPGKKKCGQTILMNVVVLYCLHSY